MRVAVGIVLNERNQILIAERQSHQSQGGLWEFPGGKIEQDETAFDALKRELAEEVGIEVVAANHFLEIEYDYHEKKVFLNVWRVTSFLGEPRGAEGQVIRWASLHELDQFAFPEGNKEIIWQLKNAKFYHPERSEGSLH